MIALGTNGIREKIIICKSLASEWTCEQKPPLKIKKGKKIIEVPQENEIYFYREVERIFKKYKERELT